MVFWYKGGPVGGFIRCWVGGLLTAASEFLGWFVWVGLMVGLEIWIAPWVWLLAADIGENCGKIARGLSCQS